MDDLAATMHREFELVHAEIADVRAEIRELRADLSAWQRQNAQIGWALVATLIGTVVALIVTAT